MISLKEKREILTRTGHYLSEARLLKLILDEIPILTAEYMSLCPDNE